MGAPDPAAELYEVERAEVDRLMQAARTLSHPGRLELHRRLAESLVVPPPQPSPADKLARRQRDALAAMAAVARAARCEPGQAPTTTEFTHHARRLGLPWSVSSVGRAFRSWSNAQKAYESATPESARPIRQRDAIAHGSREHADYLEILARWSAADPDDSSVTGYERWRKQYNATGDGRRLAPSWRQITRTFPELSPEDLRAAARGEVADVIALCRTRAKQRLRDEPNPLQLVGVSTFAALVGLPATAIRDARKRKEPGFPAVVLTIGNDSASFAQDVYAWRDRGRAPSRRDDELAGTVIGLRQVAELVGLSISGASAARSQRGWHRIPQPDGRFATSDYWLRESVDRWLANRDAPTA